MKTGNIGALLFLLVGLWTFLIWNDTFEVENLDTPQNEDLSSSEVEINPVLASLISTEDKTLKKEGTEMYTVMVLENCEYFANIHDYPPQITHKGNCKNCH